MNPTKHGYQETIFKYPIYTLNLSNKCAINFFRESTHENKQFKETKNMDIKFILDKKKASEGSVVNRALSSLHGGSHEITLTVPLSFDLQ